MRKTERETAKWKTKRESEIERQEEETRRKRCKRDEEKKEINERHGDQRTTRAQTGICQSRVRKLAPSNKEFRQLIHPD